MTGKDLPGKRKRPSLFIRKLCPATVLMKRITEHIELHASIRYIGGRINSGIAGTGNVT